MIAGQIRSPLLADFTYLAIKPVELAAMLILRARPERGSVTRSNVATSEVNGSDEDFATTPSGLSLDDFQTQGNSFLATLGWMTQSRWDWRNNGEGSRRYGALK